MIRAWICSAIFISWGAGHYVMFAIFILGSWASHNVRQDMAVTLVSDWLVWGRVSHFEDAILMGFVVIVDLGVWGAFDHLLELEFPAREGLSFFLREVLEGAIPNVWVVRMRVGG
jgi:hypothetical protein